MLPTLSAMTYRLISRNTCIVLVGRLELGDTVRHGLWLKNKRQVHPTRRFDALLIRDCQARHFKSMMKEAGHLDQIKRLRISDKDLVPFTAAYDVSNLVQSLGCPGPFTYPSSQTALSQLKESYRPHWWNL